jgi:hypothetical protein
MTARGTLAAALVAVLATGAGASAVLAARDRGGTLTASGDRFLYVRSPRVAKLFAGNFATVAADVYWLRTIQHFGGDRLSGRRDHPFELLAPLLNLTTSLDPHFSAAYRFGAMFLSEPPPGGPGDHAAAIALLQKGLRVDPHRWQYAHDIGFVYLWQGVPDVAAAWFRAAAGMPGAPNWLEPLAATTMMSGANRGAARTWLTEMRQSASEAWVRQIAERRLAQLQAMDDIDALRALVPRYQAIAHANPAGWQDFIRAGLLRAVPVDPSGAPYEYFPASGMVRLHPSSALAPLPALPGTPR